MADSGATKATRARACSDRKAKEQTGLHGLYKERHLGEQKAFPELPVPRTPLAATYASRQLILFRNHFIASSQVPVPGSLKHVTADVNGFARLSSFQEMYICACSCSRSTATPSSAITTCLVLLHLSAQSHLHPFRAARSCILRQPLPVLSLFWRWALPM